MRRRAVDRASGPGPVCRYRSGYQPFANHTAVAANESFKAQKMLTSQEWKKMYSDGTVTNWLQQSTDFFMANAGVKDFTPASKYFDPGLYLKTIA